MNLDAEEIELIMKILAGMSVSTMTPEQANAALQQAIAISGSDFDTLTADGLHQDFPNLKRQTADLADDAAVNLGLKSPQYFTHNREPKTPFPMEQKTFNEYVQAECDIPASKEPLLFRQTNLDGSKPKEPLIFRQRPSFKSDSEDLKKFEQIVQESQAKKDMIIGKYITQQRFNALMSRAKSTIIVSGVISLVFNLGDLMKGDIFKVAWAVGKDVGFALLNTCASEALKDSILSEGAGVIVLAVFDAWTAFYTGDWTRFGLNICLNTVATVGAYFGGSYGASWGAALAGPWGALIGGVGGAIVGGVGAKFGASLTPLGAMTQVEKVARMNEIREKINESLNEFGVELDPDLTWDEYLKIVQSKDKNVNIKLRALPSVLLTPEKLNELLSSAQVNTLLNFASTLDPINRKEGLKRLAKIFENRVD